MLNIGLGDISGKSSVQEDKIPGDFTPPRFNKMSRQLSIIPVAALRGALNALL
jgi:hypothetical protein